jgi:4-amino-4-deoxy-L-arabinose transferase-like glycosyltransferase
LRAAWPALVLAAAVLVPFLDKAHTIDDPLFLYQARQLTADPWHPTAFTVTWSTAPERMSAIMASAPGMAYLLYPTILAGGAEWAAHLTQLVLLGLASWAVAALALRIGSSGESARAAALLLAATPAALGMAGTAMPDVAAMAFGALGVERTLAWSRERRAHQAVAAAVALAAAALCRSHLIALTGVAALAVWSARSWRSWIPLAAVPALVAAVLVVTGDPVSHAGAVAGAARRYVFGPALVRNVVSYFVHAALVLPLAVPWLALRWKPIVRGPVLYVATAAAWFYIRSTPEVGPVWAAPIAGLGIAVVWDLVSEAIARRDGVQLVLGAWLLTPLLVAPYLHLPAKYALAAAPAMALAVARRPESTRRVIVAATVALGIVLGVLILRADERFAGLGRRAAAELVAPRVAAGRNVWFNGHWGFQWYAERAGARPLTTTPPHPRWGDLVIATRHAEDEMMGAMPHRRLIETLEDVRPGGRVMSRTHDAGFFSNGWGYLPWAWGSDPVDRYEVWSIEAPALDAR